MPSAVSPNPQAAPAAPDDLDNLFNYDDAVEDFLKDLPIDKDQQNSNTTAAQDPTKNIDEEITVKKKRKPVPKLDENLLLSEAGVPKLRKITKSRLKFRGKGHEFSDMSMLLNTYQLWLDDLYPRAKFKDALTMVEKLGHSKRMQVTRRAWLDSTKPQAREVSPERIEDVEMSGGLPAGEAGAEALDAANEGGDAIFGDSSNSKNAEQQRGDAPDDDELDALLAESTNVPPKETSTQPKKQGPFIEDDVEEDELDQLLAQQPTAGSSENAQRDYSNSASRQQVGNDDFADEEEIMAGMDW